MLVRSERDAAIGDAASELLVVQESRHVEPDAASPGIRS